MAPKQVFKGLTLSLTSQEFRDTQQRWVLWTQQSSISVKWPVQSPVRRRSCCSYFSQLLFIEKRVNVPQRLDVSLVKVNSQCSLWLSAVLHLRLPQQEPSSFVVFRCPGNKCSGYLLLNGNFRLYVFCRDAQLSWRWRCGQTWNRLNPSPPKKTKQNRGLEGFIVPKMQKCTIAVQQKKNEATSNQNRMQNRCKLTTKSMIGQK